MYTYRDTGNGVRTLLVCLACAGVIAVGLWVALGELGLLPDTRTRCYDVTVYSNGVAVETFLGADWQPGQGNVVVYTQDGKRHLVQGTVVVRER